MRRIITIGWTKSDMANGYSSFDGYRAGAEQHTETFEANLQGDDLAICEAVFEATNAPQLQVGSEASIILHKIRGTGYRGEGAHFSFSVGDTVTIDGRTYACESVGFKPIETPIRHDDMIPYDLRLSFTPDAIREHFEGDEPDPTEGMSDEELAEVGRTALTDDGLYRAFHEALEWALGER